jgi:hypothetical protein
MAEDGQQINGVDRHDAEKRSVGSAAQQFLSNVPIGAGLTTGGLIAKDGYAKIKDAISKEPPKK